MSKIKLKTKLENTSDGEIFNNNVFGIKQNDKITYNEDNIMVNIVINDHKLVIIRRCDEYELVINLVNNTISSGTYYIQNVGTLDLSIRTNILEFSNNKIYAEYELTVNEEVSKFIFSLEYEEML